MLTIINVCDNLKRDITEPDLDLRFFFAYEIQESRN